MTRQGGRRIRSWWLTFPASSREVNQLLAQRHQGRSPRRGPAFDVDTGMIQQPGIRSKIATGTARLRGWCWERHA